MKRSKHNLSHYKLMTGNMGVLYPTACVEVLPGDTIQQASQMLCRASPLATPPMHPVKLKQHHWFVPTRLIWDEFEQFITGGADGNDATAVPEIDFSGAAVAEGDLAEYFGIPTGFNDLVSALPFRAYNAIFNEYYRDQDLVTALTNSKASGTDSTSNTDLQSPAWEKDYFTSARPWEQKGDEVVLPIGSTAPVYGDGTVPNLKSTAGDFPLAVNSPGSVLQIPTAANGSAYFSSTNAGLYADLSGATGVPIPEIREAFALQRYKEARARFGSRYSEYLAYLGVRSSDARLSRPEYLGGGQETLQFSEILQTGVDSTDAGVGTLRGHGIGSTRSNRYRKFFEEHGYIISLAYVMPKTMYTQGLPRAFSRQVKEDYFQKELQHIGQQPILNKELYYAHASPEATFGFQDRYDEYRRMESTVSGEFRSTLNDWHFARIFASDPTLNGDFVSANPAKRPFQDQASDVLWMMIYHQIVARRMVSKQGNSFIY